MKVKLLPIQLVTATKHFIAKTSNVISKRRRHFDADSLCHLQADLLMT